MAQYRKRPTVVDAVQFDGTNAEEIAAFLSYSGAGVIHPDGVQGLEHGGGTGASRAYRRLDYQGRERRGVSVRSEHLRCHLRSDRVMERCMTCRFFETLSTECRRHSPTAHVILLPLGNGRGEIKIIGAFPATKPENWCGEYRTQPGEEN